MKIMGNPKHQKPNFKWFDRLTTLSPVEGQIPIAQIQNSKPSDSTGLGFTLTLP